MKLIQLTQNQVAKVDDSDFDALCQHKWCASWSEDTKSYYAKRNVTYQDGKKGT